MWELKEPKPVKLIVGILAANEKCLCAAREILTDKIGEPDLVSDIWPFVQTSYYEKETGKHILRQLISIKKLIQPGKLAKIKHKTNRLETKLAKNLAMPLARPVNLDPGLIEPSKLVLATTKNFSHRIYIGKKMYAEVTLIYDKRRWKSLEYTYPDYQQECYHEFFTKVREKLLEQLKSTR